MEPNKYLIISMRRTGGSLLGNLFDGHPDCSVFPFEYWHTSKKAVYDPLRHRFFRWLPASLKRYHCGTQKVWEKKIVRAHGQMHWLEFYEELLAQADRSVSAAELYDRTIETYFTRFHLGGVKPVVINHCANLCTLNPKQLRTIFGKARYIMTVRDPRASFASTERKDQKKLDTRGKIGAVAYDRTDVEAYCNLWRKAVETYYFGSNQGLCLRFEDLVREPAKAMNQLAAAMNISFDDVLLTPLRIGEAWVSNSSFARTSGIDSNAADKWRTHLSPEWRHLIEDRLGDIMERLGYEIDAVD